MAFSNSPNALRDYVAKLKRLETKLHDPSEFYKAHREEYVAVARTIIYSVLNLGRPPEFEAGDWARRVSQVADRLSSSISNLEDEAKLNLFINARRDEQQQFEEIAGAGVFGKDTVLQWVRAGRSEDPLGKHLDDRDSGDSDETIAARVWWALYTGRSQHSAELIRIFMQGKSYDAVTALLPAVQSAWQQTFTAMVKRDWAVWIGAGGGGGGRVE